MKDLEQAAMFRNWVQEIEKHHLYLDLIKPTKHELFEFLEYIDGVIGYWEMIKMEVIRTKPTMKYQIEKNGETFYFIDLERYTKIKVIVLEWKNNKDKRMKILSEAIDIITETEQSYFPIHTSKPIEPKKTPPQVQKSTFDELFHESKYIEPCINLLKQLDPPLIDSDCNFIGNNKNAICIWVDEMVRNGIMKPQQGKTFALLIPQRIKGLSISESLFRKVSTRAKERYGKDIAVLISQIKHSQDYQ